MVTTIQGHGRTIWIAGHTGLIGSALVRRYAQRGDRRLLVTTRAQVDLTDQQAVRTWLASERPQEIILAAGKIGGIQANAAFPADFIYDNLMMEANIIHGAWEAGVRRLLNFGSSCMYPRQCPQPMSPERLMTGKLEPTSEPYALAKLAGLSLCLSYNRQHGTRFVTAIPCTVYGPGDSFDCESAHVVSALLRKLHEAVERGDREVTLWGSGQARREFLYVDDVAEACERLLEVYEGDAPVNVGSGAALTIREIAGTIAEVVGFRGRIVWDASRPDGAPEKVLDASTIQAMGWVPRTDLRTGLTRTHRWFVEHEAVPVGSSSSCASS